MKVIAVITNYDPQMSDWGHLHYARVLRDTADHVKVWSLRYPFGKWIPKNGNMTRVTPEKIYKKVSYR